MKAFAARGRFDETQPFAPWLIRVAISATVASLRRSRDRRVAHADACSRRQVGEAAAAVREALATVDRRIEGNRRALMPYVALLAILPLGFVLYRRNL